jgi:HK97 gp10 family phage protein
VKEAAYEAVVHARDKALDAGEHEAESKLERIDDTHGYDLPIDIGQETVGHQSGRIFYENWWGHFFEYGTVFIRATPFMRPASRKMRKVFIGELGDSFEGWVKRKARVRR